MRKGANGKVVVLGMFLAVFLLVCLGTGGDWRFAAVMLGTGLLVLLPAVLLFVILPIATQNLATFLLKTPGGSAGPKSSPTWSGLAPGWRFLLLVLGAALTLLPASVQRPVSAEHWAASLAWGAGLLAWFLLSAFSGNLWICAAMLLVPMAVFLLSVPA